MADNSTTSTAIDRGVSALIKHAGLLAETGRSRDAEAVYRAAVECDPHGWVRNAFGAFLFRLDRHAHAIEQFRTALKIAVASGDAELRSAAANNLAAVYRELGRYPSATGWQQQSLSACLEASGSSCRVGPSACDLSNRGNDAILAGNLCLAEQLFRRSLLLERVAGSTSGQASDWGSLGIVAMLRSQYRKAIVCLWRAYRLHQRAGDDRGAGCDLLNLAETCFRLGKHRAAGRFLRHGGKRLDRAGATRLAAKARLLLQQADRIAGVATRDPLLN